MSLEETLKHAGVDTNRARLLAAAEAALRSAKWRPEVALAKLMTEVNADTRLLRGLHQLSESASRELAQALLSQLTADAKGPKREAASQAMSESQWNRDRRPPAPIDSSRASHISVDSPRVNDRSTAPSTSSRASLSMAESLPRRDRPAADPSEGGASQSSDVSQTVSDPSRSLPTRGVSANAKSAARSVLKSSVFDKRIVAHLDVPWGDLTGRHLKNMHVHMATMKSITTRLLEAGIVFTDDDTPLRKLVSDMRKIERVASLVDKDVASAVAAVRSLTNAVASHA